jgi:hypothetical protein
MVVETFVFTRQVKRDALVRRVWCTNLPVTQPFLIGDKAPRADARHYQASTACSGGPRGPVPELTNSAPFIPPNGGYDDCVTRRYLSA